MEIIYPYVTTQTNVTFILITVVFFKQLLDWEKILNWLPTTTISCFISRLVAAARLDRSCADMDCLLYSYSVFKDKIIKQTPFGEEDYYCDYSGQKQDRGVVFRPLVQVQ